MHIQRGEYEVKVAFLYNFLRFTAWPNASSNETAPIIIGIVGEADFGKPLEILKKKKMGKRPIRIVRIESYDAQKMKEQDYRALYSGQLIQCTAVFVCKSEHEHCSDLINMLSSSPILTIGEHEDFLRDGGMVSLLHQESNIVFDVNLKHVEKASLKMRGQVLRMARKVVKND